MEKSKCTCTDEQKKLRTLEVFCNIENCEGHGADLLIEGDTICLNYLDCNNIPQGLALCPHELFRKAYKIEYLLKDEECHNKELQKLNLIEEYKKGDEEHEKIPHRH